MNQDKEFNGKYIEQIHEIVSCSKSSDSNEENNINYYIHSQQDQQENTKQNSNKTNKSQNFFEKNNENLNLNAIESNNESLDLNLSFLPMNIKSKILNLLQINQNTMDFISDNKKDSHESVNQNLNSLSNKGEDRYINPLYKLNRNQYLDSNGHITSEICTMPCYSYWDQMMNILKQIEKNGFAIVDNFISNLQFLDKFIKKELPILNLTNGKLSFDRKLDIENRGDLHVFIKSHEASHDSSSISKDEETSSSNTFENLDTIIFQLRQIPILMNQVFDCQLSSDSIQVAVYPSNGKRYVKHSDSSAVNAPGRKLTFLLYLNNNNIINGGSLRFYPNQRSIGTYSIHKNNAQNVKENNQNYFIDIEPRYNRLVVFPSEYFHEVLPSYFERRAITMWNYSKYDIHRILMPKLHTLDLHTKEQMENTIFVSICSYRDSECGPTVRDLFYKAKNPHRIRVGILLQYNKEEDLNIINKYFYYGGRYASQIREIRIPHTAAKGPIYARSIIQKYLYDSEDFYLQIDSHMRFERDWDVKLINQLHKVEISSQNNKCIITGYPPGYKLPNEIPKHSEISLLVGEKFKSITVDTNFNYEILRLKSASVLTTCNHPPPTYFWAAGFSFSRGTFVRDLPYDNTLEYVFFGEETLMSIKLFEQGYHLFCPDDIIVYHLWSRKYRPTFRENEKQVAKLIQEDTLPSQDEKNSIASLFPLVSKVKIIYIGELEEHRPEEIQRIKIRNMKRVMSSLYMINDDDTCYEKSCWTNFTKDLIERFEYTTGVSFKERTVSPKTKVGNFHQSQYIL